MYVRGYLYCVGALLCANGLLIVVQKKHVGLMLQEDLSEKRKRMSLRRHSMNASMFDPLSIRDVIRRSHDDLTVYCKLFWVILFL